MATRKIRHKVFVYDVKTDQKDSNGNPIIAERMARRGETVELTAEAIERGDRLGSFFPEEQPGGDPELAADAVALDPKEASLDELVAWIEEDKPTIKEVMDAADGDAIVAKRLLDAENAATGNDPRVGLVEGLTAIVQRGAE